MGEKEEVRQTTHRRVTKSKKGGMKAYSKRAMVFSSVWLVVATVLRAVLKVNISMQDILIVAVSIVAIWTPGYISIWIDKVSAIISVKEKLRSEVA